MALGVTLGAFGAHALKDRLDAYSLDVYQKAVFYHFIHALGILIVSALSAPALSPNPPAPPSARCSSPESFCSPAASTCWPSPARERSAPSRLSEASPSSPPGCGSLTVC